jgi:valyl-tRNA synthetase
MAAMESQGRDVKMDEKRVEGYRNFATKLWNAARFCQSNGIGASQSLAAPHAVSAVNKWIVGEVVETLAELDKAMADLRFDAAANAIYHFVWDTFCDWYIELVKGQFDEETKKVAGWVLDQILVMLHPFMPFVTEELWASMGERPYELIVAQWPAPDAAVDSEAKREVDFIVDLVSAVRSTRTDYSISPSIRLPLFCGAKALSEITSGAWKVVLERLARVAPEPIDPSPELQAEIDNPQPGVAINDNRLWAATGMGVQLFAGGFTFTLGLGDTIDIAAEKARLEKALAASQKEARSLEGRLNNPSFVEKAKPEAVEKARADYAAHATEAERLAAALARLG